ncbi:MAG: hypothetical protein KDJ69_03860 [Nitratireductor sp.]|nr:hypothetical protein [Nitratireductor sp.]
MLKRFFHVRPSHSRKALPLLGIAAFAGLLTAISVLPALALSPQQQKGMYRHGMWEWSIRTCPGVARNKGYWYALREVGEFENSAQIVENEDGPDFKEGWSYMDTNAKIFGVDTACDYAVEQWPAVLYRD